MLNRPSGGGFLNALGIGGNNGGPEGMLNRPSGGGFLKTLGIGGK